MYQANLEAYLAELDELHAYVQEQILRIPEGQRVLITAHDAFGYYGEQYGIDVRGLQGMSTATEATAGDIQALAEFIAERQIPAIFVESSVPPATIEAVQEAVRDRGFDVVIGGQLFSDAMGAAGTPEAPTSGWCGSIPTPSWARSARGGHRDSSRVTENDDCRRSALRACPSWHAATRGGDARPDRRLPRHAGALGRRSRYPRRYADRHHRSRRSGKSA